LLSESNVTLDSLKNPFTDEVAEDAGSKKKSQNNGRDAAFPAPQGA